MCEKIKTREEITAICQQLRTHNKKIVTTNGVFDILHIGHAHYLAASKKLGDVLVVCVNTDESVKQNKGDKRPLNTQQDRAEMLAALSCVDYVVLFNETEPSTILSSIKPHIHTKAADYTIDKIIERKVVEQHGGKVVLLPIVNGKSTTNLIKKIIYAYANDPNTK